MVVEVKLLDTLVQGLFQFFLSDNCARHSVEVLNLLRLVILIKTDVFELLHMSSIKFIFVRVVRLA